MPVCLLNLKPEIVSIKTDVPIVNIEELDEPTSVVANASVGDGVTKPSTEVCQFYHRHKWSRVRSAASRAIFCFN